MDSDDDDWGFVFGVSRIDEKPDDDLKAYRHLQVTPLVDIYSVSIHNNHGYGYGEKCEIYGRIRVVDNSGDDYDLFIRDKDNPECIDVDATLLLSPPLSDSNGFLNVIVPSDYVSVDVLLFDKAHNDMLIAQGGFTLDRTRIDCKVEQACKRIPGNGGFEARVHYAIFPFAVVATVSVLFFNKQDKFDILSEEPMIDLSGDCESDSDDSWVEADDIDYDNRKNENDADVFGIITAHTDSCCSPEPNDYYYSNVLFKTQSDQSVKVDSRGFIRLSRSNIAVPAYSSLKIEVDLSDCDSKLPICRGSVVFKPQDRQTYKKDIVEGNGLVRVRVQWNAAYHAYQQFDRARKLNWSAEDAKSPEIGNAHEQKRPKLQLGQHSPVSVFSSSISPLAISNKFVSRIPMVEVFSVAVCGKSFEPFSFYGEVNVNFDWPVFRREASCPQQCPALGTHLMIGSHRCFNILDPFSIWVDLKDANNRTVICEGCVGWGAYPFKDHEKWMNRHLCSVIRGDRGFTSVHYAIFSDALAAEVNIRLYGSTASSRVSGKIVAQYDTHDYSSSYDREYYQSVLFHKDAKEVLEIHEPELPLLKSVVAMPRNSPLVLYTDLLVSPLQLDGSTLPQETKSLQGGAKFHFSFEGESSSLNIGHDVYITVSVSVKVRKL